MKKKLLMPEYKRRVFNRALLECFCRIHGQILNGSCEDDAVTDERMSTMANKLCSNFYTEELNLKNATVQATQARLAEAVHFLKECGEVCEDIADHKVEDAKEEGLVMEDDQKIELSDADKAVLDQVFENRNPTPQIDAIRDATVNALVEEEKKSKEIKDAIDIAKSQVASGENPNALEETTSRLGKVGPTSLMGAIMNNITVQAIRDINESGNLGNLSQAISDNAQSIKSRAAMMYSLYEMASAFGIHHYTNAEVKKLAFDIYHDK